MPEIECFPCMRVLSMCKQQSLPPNDLFIPPPSLLLNPPFENWPLADDVMAGVAMGPDVNAIPLFPLLNWPERDEDMVLMGGCEMELLSNDNKSIPLFDLGIPPNPPLLMLELANAGTDEAFWLVERPMPNGLRWVVVGTIEDGLDCERDDDIFAKGSRLLLKCIK